MKSKFPTSVHIMHFDFQHFSTSAHIMHCVILIAVVIICSCWKLFSCQFIFVAERFHCVSECLEVISCVSCLCHITGSDSKFQIDTILEDHLCPPLPLLFRVCISSTNNNILKKIENLKFHFRLLDSTLFSLIN